MNRNKVSFVKPMLEELEDRVQPSFLLSGTVGTLATPLNNMVNDMNSASTDLQTQFNLIKNATPPANTFAGAEAIEAKAVGDWQRILNDSASINATVNADMSFIRAVAFAELSTGDATDALVLTFGTVLGINPTSALTNTVSQANSILTNPTLQNIINTNLHTLNSHVDSTTPIAQVTVTPSF
jgi:hypothetical protein